MNEKRITSSRLYWSHAFSVLWILSLLSGSMPLTLNNTNPQSVLEHASRIQPILLKLASEEPDEVIQVIVQKLGEDSSVEQTVLQAGGQITRDLSIINAFTAKLEARSVSMFAQMEGVRWVSLDAPTMKVSGVNNNSVNIRDEFNTHSYAGNDGRQTWSSTWNEIGESDGPNAGDIIVTRFLGGAFGGLRIQGPNKGVSRKLDLSLADAAQLTLTYRRKNLTEHSDTVAIELSTDDGVTWTEVGQLSGATTDSTLQSAGFDISPYISENTTIRFVSSSSLSQQERVYINHVDIEYRSQLTHKQYLPLITTGGASIDVGTDSIDTIRAATLGSTVAYYLHNNPSPPTGNTNSQAILPLDQSAPTTSVLYNYDVDEDSDSGLMIKKTNKGLNEDNPKKIQRWQLSAFGTSMKLSGNAALKLYAAMKDFKTDKVGQVSAYLLERNGGTTTVVASQTIIKSNWNNGWNLLTLDFGAIDHDFPAGSQLEIALLNDDGQTEDDLWLAYGTTSYPASLMIGTVLPITESIHIQSIDADHVWDESGLQGQNIAVAVVDSGIAEHPDLQDNNGNSRIIADVKFGGNQGSSDDSYGHGTHVAGIIAGNGARSNRAYIGIAPKSKLVDVKVMNDFGMGDTSDVVEGLGWILENKSTYNIRAVNLSLNSTVSESYHTSPLNAALEILWFNGIVVVVSAGNNGNNGILYPPANDPFVITTGAVDTQGTASIFDDFLGLFSASGTTQDGFIKPELIVPGANIVSLLASNDSNLALAHPAHTVAGPYGNDYFRMSGTSVAAGVVTGAVALLLQDEPNLTPDQVKYRLTDTATTILGSNYLNIHAAINGTSTASANTGIEASQMLWTGSDPITWGSVNWNSVNWNSVNWNSVNWNSVNWNSVNWNSVHWDD